MYIFSKVLDTERLRKEEPKIIGKYVVAGRTDGEHVWVRDTWNSKNYKLLPNELSPERYEDAFGTKLI